MTRNGLLRILMASGFAALLGQVAPDPAPRWWRGNLHTHTLWSDGDGFPEPVVEWYRDHGYHFLALSDHNLLSVGERWMRADEIDRRAGVDAVAKYRARYGGSWVQTRGPASALEVRLKTFDEYRTLVEERGRFLMLQSEELTGVAGDGRSLHMNATNLAEQLVFQVGASVRESMTRNLQMAEQSAKRTGREVMLHVNHPNYKWGVTAEDLAAATGERFFEVWNGVDNDNDPGDATHASTDAIWDVANTLRMVKYGGSPLYGLATDDSHEHHGNKSRSVPGRAWVMARARHLSPESILRAMRAGDFYSSTGVELDDVTYDRASRTLALKIKARAGERFTTRFVGTRQDAVKTAIQGKPRGTGWAESTLDYGPRVGEVLAESAGTEPRYTARGDELYVRAIVTSSAETAVPSAEFRYQRAWTQPVVP